MSFTCRHCRALLPGYIQRELTPKQRVWVSRHLNECDECYVACMEQRQLVRELSTSIPRIGTRGESPPFDALRAAVLAQVAQPGKPARSMQRMGVDYARYSIAVLLLVVVLLLPLSTRGRTFNVPTPPTPDQSLPQGTAVAALPAESATLTATLQPNYAPFLGATDTP